MLKRCIISKPCWPSSAPPSAKEVTPPTFKAVPVTLGAPFCKFSRPALVKPDLKEYLFKFFNTVLKTKASDPTPIPAKGIDSP